MLLLDPKAVAQAALDADSVEVVSKFVPYRYKFAAYCHDFLDVDLLTDAQQSIADDYILALRQQEERIEFENDRLPLNDLECYNPSDVIQNWISVDAGHTVGKTWLLAKVLSHFFDCYDDSIIYCFAPIHDQLDKLLFKEVRKDRTGKVELPGTVMLGEPRISHTGEHFVIGKAVNDSHGQGSERAQGQHGQHLMFIVDEAEGVPDFIWDAIESMASGGIAIVISARNPRTTTCYAHRMRALPKVSAHRISCFDHPNVIQNRDIIPGAVRRDYINDMLETHAEVVDDHSEDDYTFEVPWNSGTIYKPHNQFLWRVLGIASGNIADNTFCPTGRYEAAKLRDASSNVDKTKLRIGVDVARFGNDFGTLYVNYAGEVWRERVFAKQDYYEYFIPIKQLIAAKVKQGVTDVQIRIDGGGGFGGGVVSHITNDLQLMNRLDPFKLMTDFRVFEVHTLNSPYDRDTYLNIGTEMYATACEALRHLKLVDPPEALQADLCERVYGWGQLKGVEVKTITGRDKGKDNFKDAHGGRSPDDGDGFVLAASPDYLFGGTISAGWV